MTSNTSDPVAVPVPGRESLTDAAALTGLADDALVYAQRLAQWLTRAPQIEQDLALANLSLDLLGQARALYPVIGRLDGTGRDEDDFAMLRDERQWLNVHLVEQPAAEQFDFAFEMVRLLWFTAARIEALSAIVDSADAEVAAIARRAVVELRYHLDHAHQWVVRLGDGTPESHERMQAGLLEVEPYVAELLETVPEPRRAAVVANVTDVLTEATLQRPDPQRWRSRDGRAGVHSRPMGYLLAELQHIARSHPGATW